jgi:phage terminase large subunit
MRIEYTPDELYAPLYQGSWDLAILIGGRGSGKSFNAGQYVTLRHFHNYKTKTLLLRDVSKSIKQSILENIKNKFEEINTQSSGFYSNIFQIQENGIKFITKESSEDVVITKGFRKSRVEQSADLKGYEDIDIAILEEAEDLRDEERANQLFDTLRKEGHKVIIILNTPDVEHWIIKRYFDLEPSKYDEHYNIIPKKIEGVLQIFSTFEDNHHLPLKTKKKYRSYGDPKSPNYNPEYYASQILGLARATRHGLIFKPGQYEVFEQDPVWETSKLCYGLDFGYNHPTALTLNMLDDNTLTTDTIMYMSGVQPDEIVRLLERYVINKHIPIIADSARPEIIAMLQKAGFLCIASKKGAGSIEEGITRLKALKWKIRGQIVDEVSKYQWKTDVNGIATDMPLDKDNHGVDSVRYSLERLLQAYNYSLDSFMTF